MAGTTSGVAALGARLLRAGRSFLSLALRVAFGFLRELLLGGRFFLLRRIVGGIDGLPFVDGSRLELVVFEVDVPFVCRLNWRCRLFRGPLWRHGRFCGFFFLHRFLSCGANECFAVGLGALD